MRKLSMERLNGFSRGTQSVSIGGAFESRLNTVRHFVLKANKRNSRLCFWSSETEHTHTALLRTSRTTYTYERFPGFNAKVTKVSLCPIPTMSWMLGWGSQFLLGVLHELRTHTVFFSHHHSLLLILFLFYLPVALVLVLTYLFTSLGSEWSLALSNMHTWSTPKGGICRQSDGQHVFPLVQWLTKYFSGRTMSISAGVF